jgi:hypothetical protein
VGFAKSSAATKNRVGLGRVGLNSIIASIGPVPTENAIRRELSLPKTLSGANAFEISDIARMNIGAHQQGV